MEGKGWKGRRGMKGTSTSPMNDYEKLSRFHIPVTSILRVTEAKK